MNKNMEYKMMRGLVKNEFGSIDESFTKPYFFYPNSKDIRKPTEKPHIVFIQLAKLWFSMKCFDYEFLQKVVKILNPQSRNNVSLISDQLYEVLEKIDVVDHKGLTKLYLIVYKNNYFGTYNFLIASFLYNLKLKSMNKKPLVIYDYKYELKYIVQSKKYYKINEIVNKIIEANKILYKKVSNAIYSINEIQTKTSEHEIQLRRKYSVKELYLFGSYARNNPNVLSDIDFFVVTDNVSDENHKELRRYLKKVFKKRIDIVNKKRTFSTKFIEQIKKDFIRIM